MENSSIGINSLVMHTVIGSHSTIGDWTRVEGTPNDPNPNKPFAKTENNPLFNLEGKLNPSITIVGKLFCPQKNCFDLDNSNEFGDFVVIYFFRWIFQSICL
jgi:hypothetical protein